MMTQEQKENEKRFKKQCSVVFEDVASEILSLAREAELRANYHEDVGFAFYEIFEDREGEIHETGFSIPAAIAFLQGYSAGREREGYE